MKARILIAEDDPHIRLGLVATLESEGYEVVAASDGAQALKLYPQSRYDLVVLDVMMPRASGYDVCRELRAAGAQDRRLVFSRWGAQLEREERADIGAVAHRRTNEHLADLAGIGGVGHQHGHGAGAAD